MVEAQRRVTGGWIETDRVGSHLLWEFRYDPVVVEEIKRIPGRIWLAEHRVWATPAVPAAAAEIGRVLETSRGWSVDKRATELLKWLADQPPVAGGVLHWDDDPDEPCWVLASTYDEELVAAVKRVPGRDYDRGFRRWWFDAQEPGCAQALSSLVERFAISCTQAAGSALQEPHLRRPRPRATARRATAPHDCVLGILDAADGGRWMVGCRRCHAALERAVYDTLPDELATENDRWGVELTPETALALVPILSHHAASAAGEFASDIASLAAEGQQRMELHELSRAETSDLQIHGLGADLRPFQRAGVAYMLRTRRAFLADEQGLGKTAQTLAALHADAAFPALVVCPVSLRLNWQREAQMWLPTADVQVLGATLAPRAGADLYIINYDSLHKWGDALAALSPQALVLDESHFCKNAKARRTRAAKRLAGALPPDRMLLLLTGTPVLNRPAELMPQLTLLGRLRDVGGYERFRYVYSRGEELERLHRDLRSTCFVRRKKSDVLRQLPAKQRCVIPVELDNRPEYDAAEADVIAWLRAHVQGERSFLDSIAHLDPDKRAAAIHARGEDAAVRAARAEPLVRLTKLKLLAALGKLRTACDWISSFLESGEKLVVFCHHREVAAQILARFPEAGHLLGSDDANERQAAVDRFQADDDCRLIVCSDQAASFGITLTAASNVAFVELGWNPAGHDQAEDRIHRIGQELPVTAWYLLAADTIDEKIATLIEAKRALIDATADGRLADRASVLGDVVQWLVEMPEDPRADRLAA